MKKLLLFSLAMVTALLSYAAPPGFYEQFYPDDQTSCYEQASQDVTAAVVVTDYQMPVCIAIYDLSNMDVQTVKSPAEGVVSAETPATATVRSVATALDWRLWPNSYAETRNENPSNLQANTTANGGRADTNTQIRAVTTGTNKGFVNSRYKRRC